MTATSPSGGHDDQNAILSSVTRCVVVALTACGLAASGLGAQTVRVAAWGEYDGVANSADWSTVGTQFTLTATRGHAAWVAAERVGRFSRTDATVRIGGVLRPGPRWWITVEAGTAARPAFLPRNTWEADIAALVTRRASLGLGYRRWNYTVGSVDFLTPHLTVQTGEVSWDVRVPVSRSPAERIDVAFSLRATSPLSSRAAAWVLGAAGRESYIVGIAPAAQVRSLETATGAAGLRYNVGSGITVKIEAHVVRSRPVLSRCGVGVAIEKQL